MSVLSPAAQKKVEDGLVGEGLINRIQLSELKKKAESSDTPLLSLISREQHVSSEALTRLVAHANRIPYVNLSGVRIDRAVLRLLSKDIAEHYMAVPLGEMQNRLAVAMLDADNIQAVDFLSNKIGKPLKVYAASEEGIRRVISQYDEDIEHDVAEVINIPGGEEREEDLGGKGIELSAASSAIKTLVQDSPISKALSAIIEYAARNRASDIHIEPTQKELKIRCRVDGVLREIMRLPKTTEPPLISRIKILSNLKIDEHRIPQDGQFTLVVDKRPIDMRVAIAPIVWGEQVVIRLLDKTGTSMRLEDMGYSGRPLRVIRKSLGQSNGMILTSGPTGSGKTTSLYALLQEIKNDEINIVTLEDPVEYKIEGVNQIQVNAEVGLTFATGLRSILRQDPDVVMVGEIRDKETAQLAVQAALTGHLVFASLHTNSAAGILPRLLDMDIEPFLIASTVRTVLGQRLIRKIGPDAMSYESNVSETEAIKQALGNVLPATADEREAVAKDLGYKSLPLKAQNAYTLYKGQDSHDTPGGYKGRMGLYEVFEVTESIQKLILQRATSAEIQKAAQEQGMITMRQDGYLKALDGKTTLTEVDRVTSTDMA
jgi:type IV pilus assembly protein PilB